MKEVTWYQCDHCGASHPIEEDAQSCEDSHVIGILLHIIDVQHNPPDSTQRYGFPQKLLIEISDYSGCLAEYRLVRDGSMEEFESFRREES